jgi:hypothetical protein
MLKKLLALYRECKDYVRVDFVMYVTLLVLIVIYALFELVS